MIGSWPPLAPYLHPPGLSSPAETDAQASVCPDAQALVPGRTVIGSAYNQSLWRQGWCYLARIKCLPL